MASVLAIHGLGCSADQGWPRVQRALPGLRVARVHGADCAATLPPSEWGILAQARRIAREHPGRVDVLVGHSMGGAIATRVAEISPPKHLVLIEPHVVPSAGFVVRPTLAVGPHPTRPAMDAFLGKMATIDTGEGGYDHWIRRWDWRVFHAMSLDLANGDHDAAAAASWSSADASGGGERSWVDALSGFDFPISLVWGAKSGPPENDIHAAALLKMGVPITVMDGASHWVPSEVPNAFAALLDATSRAP